MKYAFALLMLAPCLAGASPPLCLDDAGPSASVGAPVSAPAIVPKNMLLAATEGQLRLRVRGADGEALDDVPVQFEPGDETPEAGTFHWMVPGAHEGPETTYRCHAANARANTIVRAKLDGEAVLVEEDGAPVLRYNHGLTPVPDGVDPAMVRADYIHPLWGPGGEVLTEDYPLDHQHHRGVSWSWATIAWNGEERDAFAVRGVKALPAGTPALASGPVFATVRAESRWRWEGGPDLVAEQVTLRVYRATDAGRIIDVTVAMTPLVDGLEIGGREQRGYSGFTLRMAPGAEQETRLRRELWVDGGYGWGDYAAVFAGQDTHSGVAVFEHGANPGYPNAWRQYPTLNFFQPAWPGPERVAMAKDTTVTIRHRMWVHPGRATEALLMAVRESYDQPARGR